VSTHPLAATLGDTVGTAVAQEHRDGSAWLVVEFPGYGTVILPAGDFTES
jgi:hypothetical protein